MVRRLIFAAALALAPALSAIGVAETSIAAESSATADEQAIRNIKTRWQELIAAKDAAAIEQIYADDAVLMPQNEPAVVGREAIGARWARQFTLPDLNFSLQSEQLLVSSSADLAHDRGTYSFAATLPHGPITDVGKYVIVWRKIDGEWRVIADIFNSTPAAAAK